MTQLSATTLLERWDIKNLLDVRLMYESRSVVSSPEAFHGFNVVLTSTGQTFYDVSCRPILDGLAKVDELLRVRKVRTSVDSYGELLPE